MLPQIICRYTTFLSDITKSSKKYFNVYDLEKNGVLHVKLTFETTLILYMNAEAIFSVIFLQAILRCIVCVSDTIISCKEFFLMFAILTKTVFCLQFLLLGRPSFSYMNGDLLFYFFLFADHMYMHHIS